MNSSIRLEDIVGIDGVRVLTSRGITESTRDSMFNRAPPNSQPYVDAPLAVTPLGLTWLLTMASCHGVGVTDIQALKSVSSSDKSSKPLSMELAATRLDFGKDTHEHVLQVFLKPDTKQHGDLLAFQARGRLCTNSRIVRIATTESLSEIESIDLHLTKEEHCSLIEGGHITLAH